MKLQNNYGSISRLGGNRRRPFMIRKGTKIIGYHATKADALQALADYNNGDYTRRYRYFLRGKL